MRELSKNENRLIQVFLTEYKKMLNEEFEIPFNPRSLTIVSQPNVEDETRFDYISYNKWFDEINVDTFIGSSKNMIQTFLDIPIQILITAEELGRSLLSKKDGKKLIKALKLISEIKLKRQNDNN